MSDARQHHRRVNFFSADFLDDPYPHYQRIRTESPMLAQPGLRGTDWVLTRYADIRTVLSDKSTFVVDGLPDTVKQTGEDNSQRERGWLSDNIRHWLFFIDPPEHTRIRSGVARTFSRQSVAWLADEAEVILAGLLPENAARIELDVIGDIGIPLPSRLMLRLLGIRQVDADKMAALGSRIFAVFQQPMSPRSYARLGREVKAMEALISEVCGQPQRYLTKDGLLQQWLDADGDDPDFQQRLPGFLTMLLSVGQDTTKHLIGNSLLALAQNPQAWRVLAGNPDQLDAAVDELARYDTPVQLVVRVAHCATSVGGQAIAAGERMHLFLGAGLRDPDAFAHPDEIDFSRGESGHLPFGAGPHFCLGAYIARLASRAVLKRLVRPDLELPQVDLRQAQRARAVHLRGFSRLPMRLDLAEAG